MGEVIRAGTPRPISPDALSKLGPGCGGAPIREAGSPTVVTQTAQGVGHSPDTPRQPSRRSGPQLPNAVAPRGPCEQRVDARSGQGGGQESAGRPGGGIGRTPFCPSPSWRRPAAQGPLGFALLPARPSTEVLRRRGDGCSHAANTHRRSVQLLLEGAAEPALSRAQGPGGLDARAAGRGAQMRLTGSWRRRARRGDATCCCSKARRRGGPRTTGPRNGGRAGVERPTSTRVRSTDVPRARGKTACAPCGGGKATGPRGREGIRS